MMVKIKNKYRTWRFLSIDRISIVLLAAMLFIAVPVQTQGPSHPDDIYWDPTFGNPGAQNRVMTLCIDGNDLYVGGWFDDIGNSGTQGIARWDGTTWHALGDGIDGCVEEIMVHDGKVYVGGAFSHAGGALCNNIAWWDGAQWHAMNGGLTDLIYTTPVDGIVAFKGDIYVGGGFRKAGGKTVYGIARWDGSEWHDLEGGLSTPGDLDHRYCTAGGLAADDEFLYVAGDFLRAGDVEVTNFAKWDGDQWLSPNTSLRVGTRTMAMSGSDIYVGGWFVFPTGSGTVNNIARWDGSQWHTLGSGTNEMVLSICPVGNDIYVAGNFSRAGNVIVNRIAKWDGTGWTPLGSGLDSRIWTFAVAARESGEVFAGGDFHTAGGNTSYHIARWFNPVPYPSNPFPQHISNDQPTNIQLTWDISGPPNEPSGYDVYFGTDNNPPLVAPDHTEQNFDPGTLEFSTTYYWRIVPKDDQGNHATGILWRFTTEEEVTSRLTVTSASSHCTFTSNDTVTISVLIEDNPIPIDAGGVDITCDPILLSFISCEPGSLTALWQQFDAADLGSIIRIGGYNTVAIPESSSGEFARMTFVPNCCLVDSTHVVTLSPINLIDDLAGLEPVSGEVRCDIFNPDGDPNFDGIVTSGDALCAFEAYLSSPDAPLGTCGAPGWDVRGDVDCSGYITPRDALCILKHWQDGSCTFCNPSPTGIKTASSSMPAGVSIRTVQSDGQYITVVVGINNVPSLEAFGFELSYPNDKLEYITTLSTTLSSDFDHLGSAVIEDGCLRHGGYTQEPVDATTPSDLVELRFRILSALEGMIVIDSFVDDLEGAEGGSAELTDAENSLPLFNRYVLYQNHPNPFNAGTEIRYEIPNGVLNIPVQLTIFNIEGKPVRTLVNTRQSTGAFHVRWNGRNQRNESVASGVYFYVLKAGSFKQARKLVLLK